MKRKCFTEIDYWKSTKKDFFYFDPPYLITTGTYNDGKRGFKGWGTEQEEDLLDILSYLNTMERKFALSNVIKHDGKTNKLLKKWLKNNEFCRVHYIEANYRNSNYQKSRQTESVEVLITNY